MESVTIGGQKITSGQYILAKSVFPFSRNGPSSMRPAKIEHFFSHSILMSETECVSNMFAAVLWPTNHPFKDHVGKPYEIWCASVYETCNQNTYLPLENFKAPLLTACHEIDDEVVLVTVPIIL